MFDLVWPIRLFTPELFADVSANLTPFPTTREEMDATWNEMTYAPDEFIMSIMNEFDDKNRQLETSQMGLSVAEFLGKREGCLSFEQVTQCYNKVESTNSPINIFFVLFPIQSMTPCQENATH